MISINLIGFDPGTTKTNPLGWAIINEKYELIDSGYITIDYRGTERQWYIHQQVNKLFKFYDIDKCVIEKPFSPNPDSLMTMHHEIGVIMYLLKVYDIEFYDFYTPAHIKKVSTGNGRAGKKEIQKYMCELFNFKKIQKDEADSIAIAVTGIRHYLKEV